MEKVDELFGWILSILTVILVVPIEISVTRLLIILPFQTFILSPATGIEKIFEVCLGLLIGLVGFSILVGFLIVAFMIIGIISDRFFY